MDNILQVIKLLEEFRQSDLGCAWTKSQTFKSLAPQTIEEAYELAEAAELNDKQHLKSELGDILYHFLFYTLIAEEQKLFTLDDICNDIIEKHQRRMPTAQQRENYTADQVNEHWETLKKQERSEQESILDGIPNNFSALTRSTKLQKRAAEVGFDWDNSEQVVEKIHEELEEVKQEISLGDQETVQDEIGDLFFSVVNLARHLNIDPEAAMRQANRKFESRFRKLEKLAKERQINFNHLDMPTSLELWEEVKKST